MTRRNSMYDALRTSQSPSFEPRCVARVSREAGASNAIHTRYGSIAGVSWTGVVVSRLRPYVFAWNTRAKEDMVRASTHEMDKAPLRNFLEKLSSQANKRQGGTRRTNVVFPCACFLFPRSFHLCDMLDFLPAGPRESWWTSYVPRLRSSRTRPR